MKLKAAVSMANLITAFDKIKELRSNQNQFFKLIRAKKKEEASPFLDASKVLEAEVDKIHIDKADQAIKHLTEFCRLVKQMRMAKRNFREYKKLGQKEKAKEQLKNYQDFSKEIDSYLF